MQRARQIRILVEGLNAVVDMGSKKHYNDVLAVYGNKDVANDVVMNEMRLAAESAILKYKQECGR